MKKKFIFLSSLPRSGSTLLANILAQNPRIHATCNSPLSAVLYDFRAMWDNHHRRKSPDESMRKKVNVMRAMLTSYYDEVDRPVIVDNMRNWMALVPMIEMLTGEKAKIIFCHRPIPDILASFEKIRLRNIGLQQPPEEQQNFYMTQDIGGRCQILMNCNGPVGMILNRAKDVFVEQDLFRDRFIPVSYKELTERPKETLDAIYDFCGEERFSHNYNNVEQVTFEDDSQHDMTGLHKIRQRVEPEPKHYRDDPLGNYSGHAVEYLGFQLATQYMAHNLQIKPKGVT